MTRIADLSLHGSVRAFVIACRGKGDVRNNRIERERIESRGISLIQPFECHVRDGGRCALDSIASHGLGP